jgi:hypothetical protein
MSNIIVGGWSALKEDLHHATEFASNCAGPDGAKERVKLALTKVLEKFEALAIEEAKALVPVVEEIVVDEIAHVANAGTDPVAEAPVAEAPVAEAPVAEAPVAEAPAGEPAETETK